MRSGMCENRCSATAKPGDSRPREMPVYGTIASKFNDDGVTALYHALLDLLNERKGVKFGMPRPAPEPM
jgi:isobutyryl-CoA mutase